MLIVKRQQGLPGSPNGPPDNQSDTSSNDGSSSTGQTVAIGVVVAIALIVTALIAVYIYLRRLRISGKATPRIIPKFLQARWDNWHPVAKYSSVNLQDRGGRAGSASLPTEYRGAAGNNETTQTTVAGVDRNTSVRSVMTLPSYSQAPKDTEQVIGREGERGGMDTVVEFPETQEEQETARDEEMESLYQIRQARRREIAEREDRRRERREARERGDWARLEELRRESRQRSQPTQNASTGNLTADTLIAEHQSRPKERRISSVAYADVGQVRHDGTRLRANSHESERSGLLSGAAPMGEGHGRNNSDANSLLTLDNLSRPSLPFAGGRQRSDSGALSVSTLSSIEIPQPTPTTTDEAERRISDGSDNQPSSSDSSNAIRQLTPTETQDSNDAIDPRIVSMIRDSDNDVNRPPEYEHHDWGDAPDYEEAIRRRESQRNARLAVPTINVEAASEPNSPAIGRLSEENTRTS